MTASHLRRTLVGWLLVALWLLNLCDLLLTRHAIDLGVASEANPLMAHFLDGGTVVAAVFKIGIITAVALALWTLRRRVVSLAVALIATAIFAAVVTYQLLWLAYFS